MEINKVKLTDEQLDKYLHKLHIYNQNLKSDLQTLKTLQCMHFNYIPYENLDSLNGFITSLDHQDLYEKMIVKNRGGICFELNGLFNWLLESVGFNVVSYAARIITQDEEYQMRRHRVMCVNIDGERYMTDVGINCESPRIPLKLKINQIQSDGICEYKFTKDDFWGWLLWQKEKGKEWKRVFGFTEEIQMDLDYVMPTIFCDVHPLSPINKFKKLSIFKGDCNITIRGNYLKFYSNGRITEIREIKTETELIEIMKGYFNIIIEYKMKNNGLD